MIRTQVYLPESLYKDARFYAALAGLNISQLLRIGLTLGIAQQKKKLAQKKKDIRSLTGTFVYDKPTSAGKDHNDIYDL